MALAGGEGHWNNLRWQGYTQGRFLETCEECGEVDEDLEAKDK